MVDRSSSNCRTFTSRGFRFRYCISDINCLSNLDFNSEVLFILWQFPQLQAISISPKPADAIPLTDAQKRTGDGFRQEFGSPALPFAQKRLYLRPQHLNRIHIRAVRRQIPQLYACGVICVVCPRRSAAAFCHALCSILPIFLISL